MKFSVLGHQEDAPAPRQQVSEERDRPQGDCSLQEVHGRCWSPRPGQGARNQPGKMASQVLRVLAAAAQERGE